MKTEFLFAGVNLNTTVPEKNARQMHVLWIML